MKSAVAAVALALALFLAMCTDVRADREIINLDCAGQLHFMPDTPLALSVSWKDANKVFDHIVGKFRDRFKCACGIDKTAAIKDDAFLRNYHPLPAILNLLKNVPDTSQTCPAETSFLGLVDLFEEVRNNLTTGVSDGIFPGCNYKDHQSTGCMVQIKSKAGVNLDLDIAAAVKTCQNSDWPQVALVVKGTFVDNIFKPCSSAVTCGSNALMCLDVVDLLSEGDDTSRRSLSDWSSSLVRRVSAALTPTRTRTKPQEVRLLTKFEKTVNKVLARVEKTLNKARAQPQNEALPSEFAKTAMKVLAHVAPVSSKFRELKNAFKGGLGLIKEGFDKAVSEHIARMRGRKLLAKTSDLNDDFFDALLAMGLYDSVDSTPGCLSYADLMGKIRGFSQVFFPDALVASDSSYNFCVPNLPSWSDAELFSKTNWGIEWLDTEDKLALPIVAWDGGLSRGRNFGDANRLNGAAFVGSETALHPPALDTANKVLPLAGITCDGTGFWQFGSKMGGGAMAPGMRQMFDFGLEQVMAMQKCRADRRNSAYIFSRPDFMTHFAIYTPQPLMSALTIPPAGKEWNVFSQKMINAWSGIELSMSTVVQKLFKDEMKLDKPDFKVNMKDVPSCNAKDYPQRGCLMGVDLATIFGDKAKAKVLMGMAQCFSTAPSVPLPAGGLAIQGALAMGLSPLKTCVQNSDCGVEDQCEDAAEEFLRDEIPDLFDELIRGDVNTDDPLGCASLRNGDKMENKMTASILQYFTGDANPRTQSFKFCVPGFAPGDVVAEDIIQTKTESDIEIVTIKALQSYDGNLPGVTDQPTILFVFPTKSYTWPQDTEKRVRWVGLNLPAGSSYTLNIMGNERQIAGLTQTMGLDSISATVTLPSATVPVGPGYTIQMCVSAGKCWKSDAFTVVPKIQNQEPPVEKKQIVSGDANVLAKSAQAYAVYAAGFSTNAALTLGVESHRIEVTGIAQVTTGRRASSGMEVKMLVHADDTGKDKTPNAKLLAKLATTEAALISGMSSFTAAAQTSDISVVALTGNQYQDVSAAAAIKSICESNKTKCTIVAIKPGGGISNSTNISKLFSSAPQVDSDSVSFLLLSSFIALFSLIAA